MDETKKIVFKTSPLLVSVDGPDGSGKTIFTRILAVKLRKHLGCDRIRLVKPTYFSESLKSQLIGQKLASLGGKFRVYSKLHNNFFLAAMTINYRDIILPGIESGKIIILDSSEIRALAFIIDKGSPEAVRDTITRIRTGVLTCGVQPKIRLILEGNPEDLYWNLSSKNSLDSGDPHDTQEVKSRIEAYQKAIKVVQQLKTSEPVDWRIIHVHHTKDYLQKYLSNLINRNGIVASLISVACLKSVCQFI